MKKVFKTMAFTLLGLVLSVNLGWAADVTYKLEAVTSVTAGEKYVFEQSNHVAIGSVSSSALQTTATYATTSLKGNENYVWTLETATGGFYIKNVALTSNQYLNNASKTNVSLSTASSVWTFDFKNGVALISNTSNSDRFLGYTTATSYVYKAYATGNLGDYPHAITVYKLVEEGDTPTDPVDPTVTFSNGTVKATKTIDLSTLYDSDSDGAVSYSIEEGGSFATLAGTILTGNAEGTVKVKAVQAATSSYNAAEATATITVTAAPVEVVYSLVTDASKLEEGQKIIIVNSGADKALSSTQNSNNRSAVTVTCVDNKISVEEGSGVQVITLGKAQKDSKNYWTLGVDDGYLYAASSSSNYLKTQATLNDNGKWDISISDNIASITAQGTNTRNQLKNNGDIFSCYGSGQTAVKIFAASIPPTNEAVTFAAPTDGTLVIKNGATPISSGAIIQNGTVLDVTFGMTPAEAYKDVAIKVTKTDGGDDVTSTVYDATEQQITMPRYPITVAVTFTKLYKITLATDGEGTGTATMNGVTTDIYVDGETQIDLVASAVAPNEFTKWSATENILINEDDKAETYALASGDGTITATFGVSALQPLDAPTLSDPTNITYSGVTLNWQELDNAVAYNVELLLNDVTVASDVIFGETTWTPEVALQANTTYTYTVQGVGDGTTYAEENNPKAQSTVKTADYPAVVLTLSENSEETPVEGKLNTAITLPTESTQACDGKVFVGWSEDAIEGEVGKDKVTLLGETYTFTDPSVLEKTIYAVYAAIVSEGQNSYQKATSLAVGDKVIFATEDNSKPSTGVIGANSNDKDATVSKTAADWMIFAVEAGSAQGTFKFKNGANYITAASSVFKLTTTASDFTLNESSQAIWTSGSDKYALLKNSDFYRHYKTTNTSYTKFYVWKVIPGEKTYGNYCTTCQAAVAAPTFSLEGGNYSEAKTLELTATEGDIYYTINGGAETLYEEAIALNNRGTYEISAYAKVDDRTSDVVTKTYTLDWPYTSLAELAAADIPSGTEVTISFENAVIKSLATGYSIKGVYFDVQKEGKDIEIYCNSTAIPENWKVGGTLSVTNLTCAWVRYPATGNLTCWELTPSNWDDFTYNDPVHMTSIAISGEPTNKDYSAGQQLNPAGLVVTGYYNDHTEQVPHTEDITEGLTWTLPTLAEGATTAKVSVKYTEPILSTPLKSEEYEVTINPVTPAKTLQSIYVADDSKHKTVFFVGRPFSAEGLKVMAKYNIGEDQPIALANLDIDNPTFTEPNAEHTINISYTENDVEKSTSYNVEVKYMNLNDLVAATDINDHDHVYVKFENVMITNFYSTKGIYLNVQKGDKDIEIYNQSTNYPNTWAQFGTVSATLDNVEWTNYQGTWEFKISDWDVVEYTAPNIPVTSMEISPAEVSVGEAKTTTMSIVYTPEHATNKGVTWAVTEGSEFASVDEGTGVVTGNKAGTATITATLTADPTITATRTVTVTETPKCTISYYVKGEFASTQNIAREEEGTLTYVPELVVTGYTFAGWAEAAITEESATATLISTYTPGADEATKNVYAVFKRVDDSSPTYQQYAKVTSALTDWAGDYLIAYDDTHFANGKVGGESGIGAVNASVNPSTALRGNVVTKEWGDQYKVTIEACTGGYLLKTQDNKYNYQSSNNNGLASTTNVTTADDYPYSMSLDANGKVVMKLANGAQFQYNTGGYFRCYKNGSQNNCFFYKYDAGSALYTSYPVAKVKVTFNLDGGVGGCGTITVNQGDNVTLCEDAPTKNLNKFDAWSDGANKYAPSETIENVTEDIELTALWIAKQQYTISFNKAGAAGTTPDAITDYEYNEVTLPAQGDLSNAGYIFGGWNDGETTYAGGASFTMPEKNVSMTAVWVAKTNDKWYLVNSADQLAPGKQYAIVANDKEAAMGTMPSDKAYMDKVSASFNADKSMMIAIDPSAVILTLGGNATDGWTLSNNGKFLGSETTKNMSWIETIGDKVGYKWTITIADGEGDYEAEIENTVGYLCYNAGSPRFTTYSSVQSKVQLYVLVPAQVIDDEVNASTLDDYADVTVNEGGNLLIDAPKTLGDIYVMEGGKVTIQTEATLTVNNFVIKSTMAGGQSGQVIGVTTENFTITSSAYFDVTLGANGNPEKWHAFAVPFNVDAINGIYDLDDKKLTNEVNYAIMDYHGDVRAQGQYGWKKFRGIMNPGVFYLMTVDGQRTTYRMKMNGGFSASSTTITVNEYASGTDTDAGWNGIANSQLEYVTIAKKVQVLNPTSYTYEPYAESSVNFTVGTPFFYQANGEEVDGKITLAAANAENLAPAPRMGAAEAKNIAISFANDTYTDHLYISATDEATDEYQIGLDLVKMTMTNTPAVPQIFAEAYGTKLCMIDAPMAYDQASYALNLYAPAAGTYTISAAQVEGYEIYLTQNGNAIWDLTMSEATVELTKGDNTEYGLILKRAAYAPTNMENLKGMNNVQKLFFNDNIYIIRDAKVFNAQGVKVQ